jgi:hypothetical protein
MSKLIKAKIDVTKINKTKLFHGKKGTYLDLDIWVDEQEPEEWKQVSICQQQTQSERENKTPKNYIGNGELKWGWDNSASGSPIPPKPEDSPSQDLKTEGDDIPF